MEIRVGTLPDIAGITDIFNFYIEHTNARFEEEKLSLENRQQWFSQFSSQSKHQLYVATEGGVVLGFACSQLFASISDYDVHRVVSGVALPNEASIALHKRFGFREVGVLNEYAKKNGQYISSMWLEKALNKGAE
ncbi:N-acetyltransferase family protein [Vibrio sp. 10N.286.49.E11]|uniref:GNAT family N-acetyltransferase n=1 Tax=Vibrio sp. 10N.286.49.E11 TaxID=3229703 RepID=UPI0035509D95